MLLVPMLQSRKFLHDAHLHTASAGTAARSPAPLPVAQLRSTAHIVDSYSQRCCTACFCTAFDIQNVGSVDNHQNGRARRKRNTPPAGSSNTLGTSSTVVRQHQDWQIQGQPVQQSMPSQQTIMLTPMSEANDSAKGQPAERNLNHSVADRQLKHNHQSKQGGIKLPDAYNTIMTTGRKKLPGTGLTWTADGSSEAADTEAIRRAEQARLSKHSAAQSELPPAPTVITRLPAHIRPEVLDNALLLLDKPQDWESEEVARTLSWALGRPQLGYVSGLEQGATGLLVVLFGKATSLTSILQGLGSRYTATLRLGISTDTHDAAGRVTDISPWQHVTDDDLARVAKELEGSQLQVPPVLTAVKVRGKPVHELAKKLPASELVPRPVHVSRLSMQKVGPGSQDVRLDITFARRGYMRSLANEIGHRLGCGAHLLSWRREAFGGFLVDNAWTLEVLLPVARKFKGKLR